MKTLAYIIFIPVIVCLGLDFQPSSSLSIGCGPIEGDWAISATLAQDGMAECDQLERYPLKYSAMAENSTLARERIDKEIH